MARNREIWLYGWILAAIGTGTAVLGFVLSPAAGLLCGFTSGLFIVAAALFTRWRYRQLARLSDELRRINNGDYSLDLRDEREGELSILRSELYKTTVMLREQNEKLRGDKLALQNLLGDITHQLKTPLTSMFVMTDLLSEEDLPEERRREFTGRIRAQLERLQGLVTSLLKLSRLDAGTAQLRREPVAARVLLERATAPLLILMELKNQTMTMEDNAVTLLCDPGWTAEAVLNVLKNCVEHTPVGGELAVRCADNPLYGQICIEDSGEGIDPVDLPHIFDRFFRGRNAQEDSVGIGLAMAAAIVQGQGGSIVAGAGSLGGSGFTLRFPK